MSVKQEPSSSIGEATLPTRLYHGTTGKLLPQILAAGIQPRGVSGAEGQWEKYPSREDLVYLTTLYPIYFGLNAMADGISGGDTVLIVEVATDELPEDLFYPDEDFVAQGIANIRGCPLDEVHDDIVGNIEEYRHLAAHSVQHMGNLAYRGVIPPHAITRYCLLDPAKQTRLAWAGMDPLITPLNFHFCGDKYRSMVAWLFGDRDDWQMGFHDNEAWARQMEEMKAGSYREIMDGFKNRDGITVINMRETND